LIAYTMMTFIIYYTVGLATDRDYQVFIFLLFI
jgi:hypothetical protein